MIKLTLMKKILKYIALILFLIILFIIINFNVRDLNNSGIINSSSHSGNARIINFPSDRSLGTLYLIEKNLSFLSGSGEEKKDEAKGRVRITVPEGWDLELRVSPEASGDLSGLSQINPNDLQSISFYDTKITDEGLKHFQHLSGIKFINLSNTQITGAGFLYLQNLSNLERLDLTNTKITDASLRFLVNISELRSLDLSKTKISDAALNDVKNLSQLEELNLYYTNISDAGIYQIREMTQLQSLNLGWTQITDLSLSYLTKLSQLRELDLDSTNISDAGIQSLLSINNKNIFLSIEYTNITQEGFKKLSQYISPCRINVSKPKIDKKALFPQCYGP